MPPCIAIAIPNYLRLKGFKPPITPRKNTEGLPPMFVRHFRIAPLNIPPDYRRQMRHIHNATEECGG